MLRRLRDAWAQQQMDETLAWSCLAANLAILPGLGSIMARRTAVGALQAGLALAGTGLALYWLFMFGRQWARESAFPADGGPQFALGLVGAGIFALGWLWSLGTSLGILQAVRSERTPGGRG